jgi:hypothetical protein
MRTDLYRNLGSTTWLAAALVTIAACGGGGGSGDGPGQDGNQPGGPDPFGNARGDAAVQRDGASPLLPGDGAMNTPVCGSSPFGASLAEVHVLLVIDKSGSMAETPDGFDSDKWTAMKESLSASLSDVRDRIGLGLELYPVSGCTVPDGAGVDVAVQPGVDALPDILSALEATAPSGGTPTAKALARARAYFMEGEGAALTGDKYVLLATDGGPNCNDAASCDADACTLNLEGICPSHVDNCCDPMESGAGAQAGCLDAGDTQAEIAALAAAGIDTFVVGIPGSETYAASLDSFAVSGGRANPDAPPSYYAVSASGDGSAGLTSVLRAITGSLITSCRLQLDSEPPDLRKLNVEVDGEVVPQDAVDGWELDTSTAPPTVELKGETCARIETRGVENVTVLFGCPTVVQ